MGLPQDTNSADPSSNASLPGASTVRRFHCHFCQAEVVLCACCDRGNIYCTACAGPRLVDRIRRARSRYRQGHKGKTVRAAAEKRRRARQESGPRPEPEPEPEPEPGSGNSVGDRGSPPLEDKGNTPVSEPVGSGTGEPFDENSDVYSHSVGHERLPPAPQGLVRCACCGKIFIPFQRQGPRRGREARLLRARAPPARFTHGG